MFFQLDNHLGTVSVEVDESGAVITYEEYHPYGTSAYRAFEGEVSAKRYRYIGCEHDDETKLYFMGARYYAAWLGRWTAADPMGTVDGTNLYAYVRGSPIGLRDPSGTEGEVRPIHEPESETITEGSAFIGGDTPAAADRPVDTAPIIHGDVPTEEGVRPPLRATSPFIWPPPAEDYAETFSPMGEPEHVGEVRPNRVTRTLINDDRSIEEQIASGIKRALLDYAGSALEGVSPVYFFYSYYSLLYERYTESGDPLAAAIETALITGGFAIPDEVGQKVIEGDPETIATIVTTVLLAIAFHKAAKQPPTARTTGGNSTVLARNMAREGRPVGPNENAGHIVPSTGSKRHWAAGKRSRELLAQYDIDINDAANGIPIGSPRPHNTMHTRAFLSAVEARLLGVQQRMTELGYGKRAIRAALRRELRAIGREVLSR